MNSTPNTFNFDSNNQNQITIKDNFEPNWTQSTLISINSNQNKIQHSIFATHSKSIYQLYDSCSIQTEPIDVQQIVWL